VLSFGYEFSSGKTTRQVVKTRYNSHLSVFKNINANEIRNRKNGAPRNNEPMSSTTYATFYIIKYRYQVAPDAKDILKSQI